MICPYCGVDDDKVIDSRAAEGGEVIRRRRECVKCGKRFTTYERVEKSRKLMVVKRDGSREAFDADRILGGVQAAAGKRPIPLEDKLQLVEQVEETMHRRFDREVESKEIGREVARRLRDLDAIAYIRFASEYYDFSSLNDFAEELNVLREHTPEMPNQQSLFGSVGGSGGKR